MVEANFLACVPPHTGLLCVQPAVLVHFFCKYNVFTPILSSGTYMCMPIRVRARTTLSFKDGFSMTLSCHPLLWLELKDSRVNALRAAASLASHGICTGYHLFFQSDSCTASTTTMKATRGRGKSYTACLSQ